MSDAATAATQHGQEFTFARRRVNFPTATMSNFDAREKAKDYNPFCNLVDNYLVYVRVLDYQNGDNIMFTLMQDKKTKKFHGVTRLRLPDGTKPKSATLPYDDMTGVGDTREEAISLIISLTTLVVKKTHELGNPRGEIISDKSYEFTYGDDEDEMMRQFKECDMFDIRTETIKKDDSKDNPQG